MAKPATKAKSKNKKSGQKTKMQLDSYQVILRPLTKDELEIEVRGWLELLRAKIREVGGTELKLKAVADNESGNTQERGR